VRTIRKGCEKPRSGPERIVGNWEVNFQLARDSPKTASPDPVLIVIAALNNWQDFLLRGHLPGEYLYRPGHRRIFSSGHIGIGKDRDFDIGWNAH